MEKSRPVRATGAVGMLALGLGLAGCDGTPPVTCTAEARSSLNVTVIDAVTGRRLCDAAVAATEGSYNATLMPGGSPGSCSYFGPFERPGTYLVVASHAGYLTGHEGDAVVTRDACHVQTTSVTVQLQPSP
ncbi:MAG TPA: hypothetical protein VH877_14925 [Polyangia bacterium]|nr:hypothetical protein [Polyangia bacterium]